MQNLRGTVIGMFLWAGIAPAAYIIEQPTAIGHFGTDAVGQSFTVSGASGNIISLAIMAAQNRTATLTFFEGNGFGGPSLGSQSITYNSATPFVFQTLSLPTPVPVVSGQVYTFRVEVASLGVGLGGVNTNPYSGGTFFDDMTGAVANFDMAFRLEIAEEVPEPATVMLTGLGIAISGMARVRSLRRLRMRG